MSPRVFGSGRTHQGALFAKPRRYPEGPRHRESGRLALRAAQCVVWSASVSVCSWLALTLLDSDTVAGFQWGNYDVLNTLYVGRRMHAGQRLYLDLVELNPPAIFLVSELIARLSIVLGASPVHLYHALLLALALLGTCLIQHLHARPSRAAALVLSGLSYLIVLVGGGLPGVRELTSSFGQREQVFALAFVPYLIWCLEGGRDFPGRTLLLGVVGYLSSMKPHFMVLVAAVELLCWSARPAAMRHAWVVLGIGALLPLPLLLVHSPASLVALWTETTRFHLAGAYRYFDQPYTVLLESSSHRWLLGYSAVLAYFLWPLLLSRSFLRSTSACTLLVPLLAYGLVIQQHKFWSYHSMVVASLVVVLTYYCLARLLPRLPRDRAATLFALATGALVLQLATASFTFERMIREWKTGSGEAADVLKLAPYLRDRERILYYSTSIVHMQLAYFLQQRIVGRWCHDARYPSIIRHPDRDARIHLLQEYCDEQRELIRSQRPSVIVFYTTGQGLRATDPDLYETLVEKCDVVPRADYSALPQTELKQATVFWRE